MMAKSEEQREEGRVARRWLVAGGALLLAACGLIGAVYLSAGWLYESFGSNIMSIAAPALMLAAGGILLAALWCFIVWVVLYFSSQMDPS